MPCRCNDAGAGHPIRMISAGSPSGASRQPRTAAGIRTELPAGNAHSQPSGAVSRAAPEATNSAWQRSDGGKAAGCCADACASRPIVKKGVSISACQAPGPDAAADRADEPLPMLNR